MEVNISSCLLLVHWHIEYLHLMNPECANTRSTCSKETRHAKSGKRNCQQIACSPFLFGTRCDTETHLLPFCLSHTVRCSIFAF